MAGKTGSRTRASSNGARSRATGKGRSGGTNRASAARRTSASGANSTSAATRTTQSARSNESGHRSRSRHPAHGLLAAERTGPHAHVPLLGDVTLPPVEHVAWYAAIGFLTALEIIEWPVALLVTAGKFLADNRHNATLQNVGEALENAD